MFVPARSASVGTQGERGCAAEKSDEKAGRRWVTAVLRDWMLSPDEAMGSTDSPQVTRDDSAYRHNPSTITAR